jgi:hypothetical protein
LFTSLVSIADEAGFGPTSNIGKRYFPGDWHDPEFRPNRSLQVVVLVLK